jgi:hypothetical protein
MEAENTYTPDPREHSRRLRNQFTDLIAHLQEDAQHVTDPCAKALFEVSAEMLKGLYKAFSEYEEKNEPAWRESWKD